MSEYIQVLVGAKHGVVNSQIAADALVDSRDLRYAPIHENVLSSEFGLTIPGRWDGALEDPDKRTMFFEHFVLVAKGVVAKMQEIAKRDHGVDVSDSILSGVPYVFADVASEAVYGKYSPLLEPWDGAMSDLPAIGGYGLSITHFLDVHADGSKTSGEIRVSYHQFLTVDEHATLKLIDTRRIPARFPVNEA